MDTLWGQSEIGSCLLGFILLIIGLVVGVGVLEVGYQGLRRVRRWKIWDKMVK